MLSLETKTASVSALNTLLRGELAAVETYDLALESITDPSMIGLRENRDCHQKRAELLTQRIGELGGVSDKSSGTWGSLAKLVEGSAKMFGRHAAFAALEEGEDRGLIDYRNANGRLDPTTQTMFDTKLLPAQKRTHQMMSTLMKSAKTSSSSSNAS